MKLITNPESWKEGDIGVVHYDKQPVVVLVKDVDLVNEVYTVYFIVLKGSHKIYFPGRGSFFHTTSYAYNTGDFVYRVVDAPQRAIREIFA